jgi:hypothetical protein
MKEKLLFKIYKTTSPDLKDLIKFGNNILKTKIRYYNKGLKPLKVEERYIKKFKPKMKLFFYYKERNKYVSLIKKLYRNSIEKTITDANKICNNIFNMLGSGDKNLGNNINWRQDFKSGYTWPLNFYTKMKIDLSKKADIKVPWELSRFQFSTVLGKAYWYTNNKKYLEKWKELVLDWIDKNPIEYGPNWSCTMDVAIRAVNWIIGYFFFEGNLDENFKTEFYKNLYLHGLFIRNNLEWLPIRSNHYISDIVGLIYIGLFFNEKKWIDFGINELEKEMKHQVLDDGVNHETSISYHRLVTELFLFTTILLVNNGIKLPKWFMKKLEKMIYFTLYYTKPNGLAPLIGDNDNGRLHTFATNDINDHRYLLSIGSVLFKNGLFKKYSNGFNEEVFWLLGLNSYKLFKNIERTKKEVSSREFKDGGFYIVKDAKNYIIIHCGNIGLKGLGSHNHNDQLSFELNVNKKDIIIDPGAYIYTGDPKNRNLFRSTEMHNTIRIDRIEQNKFYPNILFYMENDTKAKLIQFKEKRNETVFRGEHFGYKRLKNPVIHQRSIIYNKEEIKIEDNLKGKGNHFVELFFHLAKNIKIRKISNEIKINNVSITIPENFNVKIANNFISKSYGVKEKAKVIIFYKNIKFPKKINYKIKIR